MFSDLEEYRGFLRFLLDVLGHSLHQAFVFIHPVENPLMELNFMCASLGIYSKSTSKVRILCLFNVSILLQCCHNLLEGAIAHTSRLLIEFSSQC